MHIFDDDDVDEEEGEEDHLVRWSAPAMVARDLLPARASTDSYSSTDSLTKILVKKYIFT